MSCANSDLEYFNWWMYGLRNIERMTAWASCFEKNVPNYSCLKNNCLKILYDN